MKDKDNREHLNDSGQLPVNGIQITYAFLIAIYMRATRRGLWFGELIGFSKPAVGIVMSAVFVVFTIYIIVYNHKHEKNKFTRWACYIGALAGIYAGIDYFLLG